MRIAKIKMRNIIILFFSLVLTLAVFSQLKLNAFYPKPVYEVGFGGKTNPADWFYSKTSNDLTAYLGKKGSNVPTVKYQKDEHFLEFSMNQVSSTTAVSLETNAKEPNTPTLFYRNIAEDIDAAYKITNLPFGVKEEIVLQSPPPPATENRSSGGREKWEFFSQTNTIPVKQPDGSIYFYDNQNNYLFQIDKPFMYDGKGTVSNEVSIEIVPTQKKISNDELLISNKIQKSNDQLFKQFNKLFPTWDFKNWDLFRNYNLEIRNSTPQSYQITLSADSEWLKTATYPVVIDPTITHDESAEFNGQYNRIANASTTAVQLESSYPEATLDPYTVLLLHFNEANGTTAGIRDYASTTRVITASGNASTTSAVTQLGLGNSAAFDGTGDYLSVPYSSDFDLGRGDFSIDSWVNISTLTAANYPGIASRWNEPSDRRIWSFNYSVDDDTLIFMYSTDGVGSTHVSKAWNPSINTWYHVAVTRSGNDFRLFVDGTQIGTTDTSSATIYNNTSEGLLIGARKNLGYLWEGTMDELRILKGRALTPEEIKAAASRRPNAVYTSPVLDASASVRWDTLNWTEGGVRTGDGETLYNSSGLVAQWNFNETSGTTADNAEGTAALDGTLNGFAYTASQDQATTTTGWTANNKKWGAGALMFDGTNDYVSVGDNAAWDFGAGNFTIDLWVMVSNLGASQLPLINRAKGASGDWYTIYMTNAGNINVYINDVQVIANAKWNPVFGAWYYLVLVREGTGTDQVKVYVNGVLVASGTSSANISDTEALYIATHKNLGSFFSGIIDSTRIYSRALSASEILSNYNAGNIEIQTRTGATSDPNDGTWEAWKPTTGETQLLSMDSDAANWHSDIMASTTIATSTDTVIKAEGTGSLKVKMGMASTTAGTVALWHFEETGTTTGTYLYDETANNNDATTTGTTVVDGIFGKARKFNGNGDKLTVLDNANLDFGTGDFAIDFWVRLNTIQQSNSAVITRNFMFGKGGYSDTGGGVIVYGSNNGVATVDKLNFFYNTTLLVSSSANALVTGQWYHIAVTRSGTSVNLFINGVNVASGTSSDNFSNALNISIGQDPTNPASDRDLNGTMDEPRILKGAALSADEIAETYRMGANHHLTRQISSTDLSAQTKLPFWIAADRTGTFLEAMIGESDFANYELASSTLALSTTTVLYIKGDEIASSTSIKDSSFSGKTITANGNARTSGNGKIGNSLYFDGTGDYLSLADSADWDFGTGEFAVEAWIKENSSVDWAGVVGSFDANTGWGFLKWSANGLRFRFGASGATDLSLGTISTGQWYHIAAVRAGNTGKVYLNGQQVGAVDVTGQTINAAQTFVYLGSNTNSGEKFNGLLDEIRVIKGTALSADQIRQAYEYGLRSHPITIDFGATLQPSDLISSATDYNFSLTATTSGLSATTSGLYLGDKIIVKENLGGTEYSAQGTVNSINTSTGAITVPSWDSGSTFPSGNGYSPNATVFKWQREYFDITGAATTTRNAITNFTIRPTNGAGGRTIYLDDFRYNTNYLTASSSSAITSSNNRYLQYRTIFTSTDTFVSPFLSAINTLYTSLANSFPSLIGISGGGFLSF